MAITRVKKPHAAGNCRFRDKNLSTYPWPYPPADCSHIRSPLSSPATPSLVCNYQHRVYTEMSHEIDAELSTPAVISNTNTRCVLTFFHLILYRYTGKCGKSHLIFSSDTYTSRLWVDIRKKNLFVVSYRFLLCSGENEQNRGSTCYHRRIDDNITSHVNW